MLGAGFVGEEPEQVALGSVLQSADKLPASELGLFTGNVHAVVADDALDFFVFAVENLDFAVLEDVAVDDVADRGVAARGAADDGFHPALKLGQCPFGDKVIFCIHHAVIVDNDQP